MLAQTSILTGASTERCNVVFTGFEYLRYIWQETAQQEEDRKDETYRARKKTGRGAIIGGCMLLGSYYLPGESQACIGESIGYHNVRR
jgi:hypothetical protein